MDLKRKSSSLTDVGGTSSEKRPKIQEPSGEEFEPDSFISAIGSNDVKLITRELYLLKKVCEFFMGFKVRFYVVFYFGVVRGPITRRCGHFLLFLVPLYRELNLQ